MQGKRGANAVLESDEACETSYKDRGELPSANWSHFAEGLII